MPAPFTTPVAASVPFEANRNPGFGGVPSGIQSEDVQNAIEEAKRDAIENDRYALLCSFTGNAGVGRYLEFFPGIDSFEAPITLTINTKLLGLVTATTAASATYTISFFNLAVSDTIPMYSVVVNNQKRLSQTGTPAAPLAVFPVGAQLAVRITSGSVLRPHMYFFLSSSD